MKRFCIFFLLMIIVHIFLLTSCSIDLFGLVYSSELQERWAEKDTFVYLDDSDRSLNLGENFSFIVLNDVHITENDSHGLERFVNVAEENGDSFVVISGDITQSGKRSELKVFLDFADSLSVPCYPVIGNHDIYFGNWKTAWKKMIGSSVYRIDSDYITMIMLDSANAAFGNAQINWLDKQLKTSKENTFIFSHANLFTDSAFALQQFTDIRERARFMSMLDDRCTAVFSGHVHEHIVTQAGKVRYITQDDFKSNKNYCRVTVSPGNVSYEFKSLD